MILFSVPADPGSHLFGVWCCLWNTFSALSLVRQRIHALRQSTVLVKRVSPYSALSLVRQRIHALRLSTVLVKRVSPYSALS